MTIATWIFIAGAVLFALALTKRPFRIFVLYMLPIVAAWLSMALGYFESDSMIMLGGAVIIAELVIWLIRRSSSGKEPRKQRFRLRIPRETARP